MSLKGNTEDLDYMISRITVDLTVIQKCGTDVKIDKQMSGTE